METALKDKVKTFRFYIIDTGYGCIKGTDDEAVAAEFAVCEDYFVVDTDTNTWLAVDGRKMLIFEAQK